PGNQIVHADDLVTFREEAVTEVGAKKTSGSSDQDTQSFTLSSGVCKVSKSVPQGQNRVNGFQDMEKTAGVRLDLYLRLAVLLEFLKLVLEFPLECFECEFVVQTDDDGAQVFEVFKGVVDDLRQHGLGAVFKRVAIGSNRNCGKCNRLELMRFRQT